MTNAPTIAPQMVPSPPSDDGGEREQQDPEPELEVEALGHAQERTGEAGQSRAADPDGVDHPLDVDAGGSGKSRVVGDRAGGLSEPGELQQAGGDDQDREARRGSRPAPWV